MYVHVLLYVGISTCKCTYIFQFFEVLQCSQFLLIAVNLRIIKFTANNKIRQNFKYRILYMYVYVQIVCFMKLLRLLIYKILRLKNLVA